VLNNVMRLTDEQKLWEDFFRKTFLGVIERIQQGLRQLP